MVENLLCLQKVPGSSPAISWQGWERPPRNPAELLPVGADYTDQKHLGVNLIMLNGIYSQESERRIAALDGLVVWLPNIWGILH